MIDRATNRKLQLENYSANWPSLYKEFEQKLRQTLAAIQHVEIYHVGSTSITGMLSKPIIDIAVAVSKKEFEQAFTLLMNNKYKDFWEIQHASQYRKILWIGTKERHLVHVHLVATRSEQINDLLIFKDFISRSQTAFKEYFEFKKQFIGKDMLVSDYIELKRTLFGKLLNAAKAK